MHDYYDLHYDDAVEKPPPARPRRAFVAAATLLLALAAIGTVALVTDASSPHLHHSQQLQTQVLEAAASTCSAPETGIDYVGNDIGAILGTGASDCCAKCSQRTGCGAFTWSDYDGGTCWLKSSKGATASKSGVVSAVMSAPVTAPAATTCPSVETNVDYVGNDLANVPGSGAADCCAKCSQRVGCHAFSWSAHQGGTCWLKTGKGATAMVAGVVSAVLGASSPSSTPAKTCPAFETGVDYVANDIANVQGASASDCCAKCTQRGDCGAFTWSSYNGGTCWLKSGKGATTSKVGVVSGVVQSSTGPSQTTATTAPPATTTTAPPATTTKAPPVTTTTAPPATTTTAPPATTTTAPPATTTTAPPSVIQAPPATTAPTATVTCPERFTDAEYVGNDLANVPGSGHADCCTKCAQRGGCGAFTWTNYNGGTCWLKYGRGQMSTKIGAISGYTANTLTTPAPAPNPSNLPLGYIYGGASKPQTDLPSESGVMGNPAAYPNPGCKQPNYITRNNKLYVVGPNGEMEPMAIKGVNWYGMETSASVPVGLWYNDKNGSTAYSIAAFLQRNNFNSVRLPICMQSLLKNVAPNANLINLAANRAIKTDNYMNLIKSIVKALGYRQISVLIDIHTLTITDIGMLWYNNEISEGQFLQGIDMLTQNLCSSEYYNVLGIDLKNEPASATWGDNSNVDFRAAAVRIGNRMLAGCPKWLAFIEGISSGHVMKTSTGTNQYFEDWWGGGLEKAKQYPVTLSIADKVVYSPHFYSPAVWHSEIYYGANFAELTDSQLRDNVRIMFDTMFGYLAQDPSSPAIVLGEFGGMYTLDKHPWKTIQRTVRYMVELMMRPGFSGGYVWSLNPESGYDWNPSTTNSLTQEGLLLPDWRYTNEPMLGAFSPLDGMADLKPLRCFT